MHKVHLPQWSHLKTQHQQSGTDWSSVFYCQTKIRSITAVQQTVFGAHLWSAANCLSITMNFQIGSYGMTKEGNLLRTTQNKGYNTHYASHNQTCSGGMTAYITS